MKKTTKQYEWLHFLVGRRVFHKGVPGVVENVSPSYVYVKFSHPEIEVFLLEAMLARGQPVRGSVAGFGVLTFDWPMVESEIFRIEEVVRARTGTPSLAPEDPRTTSGAGFLIGRKVLIDGRMGAVASVDETHLKISFSETETDSYVLESAFPRGQPKCGPARGLGSIVFDPPISSKKLVQIEIILRAKHAKENQEMRSAPQPWRIVPDSLRGHSLYPMYEGPPDSYHDSDLTLSDAHRLDEQGECD